ncbi:LINE-1 reverse transcriptase-like [Durusdinium trenchii]|uniref:LINE-1 reverse transcriptase-like n=1 Tax=Durusdinium trenchii TaxID=1381693 RepID=A0ABP0JQZ8_9DINO
MPNLDKLIGRQRTMSAFTVLIFSPPGQPLSNIYEMIILGSVALETRSMGPRCVAIVAAILGSSGNSDGTLNVGLELGTVLRSDDYFMPLIQAGKWGEAVRESAMRHQLTMMCSFCGQAYSRTADLVRHLQCHHGGFYREADLMSNLVDEAKMTCICKPCRIPQPRSHRCPAYRQLAMLQYLLDPRHRKLILPWTISPGTLHKLIQLHAALHAQVPALAPWLQCPGENSWEFLLRDSQILSTTCALCSRNFETSIQLFEHLLQQHRSQSGHNGFLLHVLYRFLLAQRMDEVMAVQEGDRLSQVGLAFLNMLASPEELEQDLPQEKRQKREVALQSQPRRKHQRPSSPHSSSTSSTRSEESGQVMKLCRLMGQLLIRHEDSLNSVSMQDSFVLFFQQGNSGVLPLLLRTAKQWHDPPADQAMIPLRSYLIQAVINELTNRFQKLKLQLSDDSTKQAAIKSLTILEDSSFPHLIWHHQHKRLVISQTAPISWSSMETHLGRSLEIADIHAQRFPLEPLTPVDGISPVASDRCTPEATWTPEVQAGTRHSDGPATSRGEEMKRKWMEDLCNLACTNDSNWCYANAGLISLLWTLVHSASFNEYTYGHIWTVTQGLLRSTRVDETIALHRHPALTDLFQGTPSGEQRDIAEFVSEVLAWCRTTQISQAWERRFENSEGCQFHHVEFMEPFSLPIFLRDGLARSWVSHRVVAVVAHLGNSLQGHFRALLLDPITGKKWLCDDNERPQEIMVIPEYFHTRGVLFWTLPCQDLDLEDSEADGMQGLTPSSVPLNLGHETLGTTCPVPTHDQAITASPEEDASWEPRPFLEGLTAAHPSLDLDAPGPMLGLPLRDDSEGRALENSSRSDTATWPQSHAVQEVAPSQPLEEDSALGVLLQRLQDADASITRALAAGPAPLADE